MKKQNKPTFAARAKALDKKYANRINDKMLDDEYNSLMENLIQEQEQVRAQMGLTNDNGQDRMIPDQQLQQFDWFNPDGQYIPGNNIKNTSLMGGIGMYDTIYGWHTPNVIPQNNIIQPTIDPTPKIKTDNKIYSGMTVPRIGVDLSDLDTKRMSTIQDGTIQVPISSPEKLRISPKMQSTLDNPNKQITNSDSNKTDLTNSYISAGATALNNILQGVLTRKPKQFEATRYIPKELDMSDRRLEAQRQAEVASNIARNQARNLGLNAGATVANQGAVQSGIDRNLASALTDISQAEKEYNVGEQNKAGMYNAEAKYKNDIMNEQQKQAYNQRILDSLSGTIGVVPELMTDINKTKAQDDALSRLSERDRNMIKLLSSGKYKYDPEAQKIVYNILNNQQ